MFTTNIKHLLCAGTLLGTEHQAKFCRENLSAQLIFSKADRFVIMEEIYLWIL